MIDHTVFVTRKILNLLKVKNTRPYLEDALLSHPDKSSLLAISDVLNTYNIDNLAVKVTYAKLRELPLPLIAQVQLKKTSAFYVVHACSDDAVSYFDNSNSQKHESKAHFLEKWTGVCLLVAKSETAQEPGIDRKRASNGLVRFLTLILLTFLALWITITLKASDITAEFSTSVYIFVYTLLKVCGLLLGTALLWFEVDQYNPVLQNFCSGGKKVNCNSVLNSKHAKLLKGGLSLSVLGFAYFLGTFLFALLQQFSSASLSILTLLGFATLPVILLSAYYQGVVIKQWCKFCLGIQIILIAEILIGYVGGFYENAIPLQTLPPLVVLISLPILAWKLIKPLLDRAGEATQYKRGFKKIKNNPSVLSHLLAASRKIETSTEGLGILIHRKTAEYNVIKVCNPYCEPCAATHPILEDLIKKGKINLQILFTATTKDDDHTAKPVRHLLSIADQGDENKTQEALDSWYMAPKKDYEAFANKYPLNGELAQQDSKIRAMSAWCRKEKISYTPTLFVNGYELPIEYYGAADLKEMLG